MSPEDRRKHTPTLDLDIIMLIGRELRRMYAGIIAEGVPERFAEILRRLNEPTNERLEKRADAAYHLTMKKGGQ